MPTRKHNGPPSDHFDGTRFFVPGHNGDKSTKDLLRWNLTEKRARWPRQWPSPFANAKPQARVSDLASTLIGHASFLVQVADLNILIDPVFAKRCSPVSFAGPARVNAPGIRFEDLPDIDAVLITHNHYDHLDLANVWRIIKRWNPLVVGPLGIAHDMKRNGTLPEKLVMLDWHDGHSFGPITVNAVPTYHWSARGLGDRRMSQWCSFVLETPAGVIYHIGDTGYGAGQFSKDVLSTFGAPRLAHIPIGAYAPRWFMQPHHVHPEEALQIFHDCGAQHAIGHHWGTFQLTNEAIEEPAQVLQDLATSSGIGTRFQAFRPGQVLSFTEV
jgi:L-ascorbate metabolism protein UlaG (beta-lactamase superfamily)